MPFNGAGLFTRLYNWVTDAASSIPITPSRFDGDANDIAGALNNCLTRDGQGGATANLPMNGFRHTGVSNGVARTDYATMGQLQDSAVQWLGTVTGTDTITATSVPSFSAYAAGQIFQFRAAGSNATTAVTINIDGLGAKSVTKQGTTALAVGDLAAGHVYEISYDGTVFQIIGALFQTPPMPSGTIVDFAGSAIPSGWLECDGSAVSRTTYAALFAALSTVWGAGDGSTTFNLPNLNGRATIGRNGGGLGITATAVGATQGAAAITIAAGNLPAHAHSFNVNSGTESASHTHADAGHTHPGGNNGSINSGLLTFTGPAGAYYDNTRANTMGTGFASLGTESAAHYHNVAGTTDNGPGAGTAISVMQPVAAVIKIIKT